MYAAPVKKPLASDEATSRWRKNSSGTSGAATRRSTATNVARPEALSAAQAATAGLASPHSGAWLTPSSSGPTPTARATALE